MEMTLEYFLIKRITILKEMLERLPDDSEFNRGVRSAYKDELFVCESILAKDKTESEATITIDEVTNTIDIKELRNKIETDICDTFDRYKPVINQDKRSQIVHKVKEHVLEIIDDTISVTSKATRKGHWILDHEFFGLYEYHCSECGHCLCVDGSDIKAYQSEGNHLFCDGCGANMREVEE